MSRRVRALPPPDTQAIITTRVRRVDLRHGSYP